MTMNVQVPQMREYLDEWTERKLRQKRSLATPEQLPSASGKTRSEVEAEVEVEEEKEVEAEEISTASAVLKQKAGEDAWKEIGIKPTGSERFQRVWEQLYGGRLDGEKLSEVMERCIQTCRSRGVSVPPPFYNAKRMIEKREAKDKSEHPRQWIPGEEVDRVAGPRGVRPELQR